MDLRALIAERARIEGDILRVDDFLNHRVEHDVIDEVGRRMVSLLETRRPDLILTAEASGIPPAATVAAMLEIPMIYAKKYVGLEHRYSFARDVVSPTKGVEYRVEIARRVMPAGQRVAVVDDFLSGGRTAEALGEMAEEAGCEVVGFAFVIEKSFADGRGRLEAHGWQVESLVNVKSMSEGVAELE